MGIDLKYGKVTVEKVRKHPIADDEPVFVSRAQDRLLPELIEYYYELCQNAGSPQEHLDLIRQGQDRVVKWQSDNYIQTPGS